MERKEWEFSPHPNRILVVVFLILGAVEVLQGVVALRRGETEIGMVLVIVGAAIFILAPQVPRLHRCRIGVDSEEVWLREGIRRPRRARWDAVRLVRIRSMGVDLEGEEGTILAIHFGNMSYESIQSIRPELHSRLREVSESRGIEIEEA
jgi:hypothetical protein